MKVALYARMSTEERDELQTTASQILAIEQWAAASGNEITARFEDEASGKSADGRKDFREMVEEAESPGRRFDAVAVLRLGRFMRDAVEGMTYAKRLQAASCSLVLVKDDILGHVDTSTPVGEFFLIVVFAIGQLERRQIAERCKEGIAACKRKEGRWGKRRRIDVPLQLAYSSSRSAAASIRLRRNSRSRGAPSSSISRRLASTIGH